jgi:hypothetical protein
MKLISDENSKSPLAPNNRPVVTRSPSNMWGWFPALSLTCAIGVMVVALAAEAGRVSSAWAEPLFWLGLLIIFVPVSVRIISPRPSRRERIAIIAVTEILLSLFRDLEQPLGFSFNDEFGQWRTALDIARSGHLFQPNPILTIGPFYPGLQIATNALSSLTGLSIFVSGMIVLGVAGLLLVLALYLFYEYLGGSAQAAAIASLLYMTKPTFFSDTLFHYEDLAIPLIAFVLFVIIRRSYSPKSRRFALSLVIWLGIAAIVVTHHAASYMLVLALLLWTIVYLLLKFSASRRRNKGMRVLESPGATALLGMILVVIWTAYTGARVVNYIYPTVQTTVNQFIQIVSGTSTARAAFSSSTGYVTPLWERLVSYASVVLITLGLPFGLFQIWKRFRANAATFMLAVAALGYPAILGLRLTNAGVNLGGRAQPYVLVAVAFVLAIGITYLCVTHLPNWKITMPLTIAIAIMLVGSWVIGNSPDWNRLPGSYQPFADQRSIQPESISAAQWAGIVLGPDKRMIGDHVNLLLMGTYGDEWLVTTSSDQIDVTPVFTDPHFDAYIASLLRKGKVQYIIVDHRLNLPGFGWYDGVGSPSDAVPIAPNALSKFDNVPNVSRVYDSGDIVIYNVEALLHGSSFTPVTPPGTSCVATAHGSDAYPTLANLYSGTLYDIPTGLKKNITFNDMRQRQGTVCGFYEGMPAEGSFTGIAANGPILGSITTANQIQFSITNQKKTTTFSFEGVVQSDGSIAGTYCGKTKTTSTCSDYGLWSVSPTH